MASKQHRKFIHHRIKKVINVCFLQKLATSEKADPIVPKHEPLSSSSTLKSSNMTPPASSLTSATVSEVKCEPVKEESSSSSPTKVDELTSGSAMKGTDIQCGSGQFLVEAEPESSVNPSTAQSCLLTSSPLREENSDPASSCASTLSPVRVNTNRTEVRTAATCTPPVKSDVNTPSTEKESVDSSVVSLQADVTDREPERTRHHSSSSGSSSSASHSHHYHNSDVLTQPNCEVPTCSTVSSVSGEIDSTREEGELNSSSFSEVDTGDTKRDFIVTDSDMDTQVDVVSHSEPDLREAGVAPNENKEITPVEQQEVSTASQSQGFEVRLDTVQQEDQASSQVDSSEGSSTNREQDFCVSDSGQTNRSRHQSATESVHSTRSRHQSAADSVSEQIEELSLPDSGQQTPGPSSVHSRSIEGPGMEELPQQSNCAAFDEVEEGEVSEGNEDRVGSSGGAEPREQEIEEGEIVDDSDEERTTGDTPTSSSTNAASHQCDTQGAQTVQAGAKDDQAVSCSTDSGVEVSSVEDHNQVSSGEDVNHGSESISDGEVVQSSGIAANGDLRLSRTNSQNQISSSDHALLEMSAAGSAEISSDTGTLPTCSTDSLVGSSNRTAGLFSSRLSSSSLTSSSSVEQKEGSSDTEVDSTSSHKKTLARSGFPAARSPADVSSSSSLNLDNSAASTSRSSFVPFSSRWPSGNITASGVEPIAEEPSSSENHTVSSELPHASTTFLSSSSTSSAHASSTTNTSPAPQSKKKVRPILKI